MKPIAIGSKKEKRERSKGVKGMENFKITYEEVYSLVKNMCTTISPDALILMRQAVENESNPAAKAMLQSMVDNVAQAGELDKPVCQSPGLPTIYIRFG